MIYDPYGSSIRDLRQAEIDAEEKRRHEAYLASRLQGAATLGERARLLSGSVSARNALDDAYAAVRGGKRSP